MSAATPWYYLSDNQGSLDVKVYVFENRRRLQENFVGKIAQLEQQGYEITELPNIGHRAYSHESEYAKGYIDFYYGSVEVTITSQATIDFIAFATVYADWLKEVYKDAD